MAEPLTQGRYSLTVGSNDEYSENGCIAAPGCIPAHFSPSIPSFNGNPFDNFVTGNNETFKALTQKGYQTRFTLGLDACHMDSGMSFASRPVNYVWAWADWMEKQSVNSHQHQQHQQHHPP